MPKPSLPRRPAAALPRPRRKAPRSPAPVRRRSGGLTARIIPAAFLVAAIAAVLLVALGQLGNATSSARTEREVVTASDGVVQSTVTGTGNLAPVTEEDVDFQTSGTLSAIDVKQGDYVRKGQLLGTLDSSTAALTLKQARATLAVARATLTADRKTLASEADSSSSDDTGSTVDDSSTPEDVDDDVSSASAATPTVAGPTQTVTTTVTQAAPTTTATATETTPATETSAQRTTRAGSTNAGSTTTNGSATTTAESSAPGSSTSGSSSSGSSGSSSSGSSDSDSGSSTSSSGSSGSSSSSSTVTAATIDSDKLTIVSDEQTVSEDKTAVDETRLRAPVSGTITSLDSIEPGDTVSSGTDSAVSSDSSDDSSTSDAASSTGSSDSSDTGSDSTSTSTSFVEIDSLRHLSMTVSFTEANISKLKVGQSATVSLDALTDVKLAGKVTAVSSLGTTSSDVVSYDATVTLDQYDSQVKPGMSASADVIIKQGQGVTVPSTAVTGSGTLATVTEQVNGHDTTKKVIVGLRGSSRELIVSGVKSGADLVETETLPSESGSSAGTTTSGSNAAGALGGSGSSGFSGGGAGGFSRSGGGGPP